MAALMTARAGRFMRQIAMAGALGALSVSGFADIGGQQREMLGASDRMTSLSALIALLPHYGEPDAMMTEQYPAPARKRSAVRLQLGYERTWDDHLVFLPEPICGSLQPNSRIREPATIMRLRFVPADRP